MNFGELHIAGHHFWHLSDQGHPDFGRNSPPLPDLLLDIYRETDGEIGKLLNELQGSTDLLLFSPEGGAPNWCDLNSLIFLPEFLYRWNFPGRSLFRSGTGDPKQRPSAPGLTDWLEALWKDSYSNLPPEWIPGSLHAVFRKAADIPGIHFPFYVIRRLGRMQFQPPVWYRPWWKEMKAFALPSYGDGYIRINLKGRESHGIVEARDMDMLCLKLKEELMGLREPVTGRFLVDKVFRPDKDSPGIPAENLPDADLVVVWNRNPNDMAEDRTGVRLGPLPFWKSGSHHPFGFIMGPGFTPVPEVTDDHAQVTDVAPTVLRLLGKTPPAYMKGKTLFQMKHK